MYQNAMQEELSNINILPGFIREGTSTNILVEKQRFSRGLKSRCGEDVLYSNRNEMIWRHMFKVVILGHTQRMSSKVRSQRKALRCAPQRNSRTRGLPMRCHMAVAHSH